MEQWEKNFYISAIAGANNGNSLVIMSKGQNTTPFANCLISQTKQYFWETYLLLQHRPWLCFFSYLPLYTGTQYTQQSYKVSDSFPFKWINKKWKEGFYVTSMAAAASRWGVVMSRNAGFSEQVSFIFIFHVFLLCTPISPSVSYLKVYGVELLSIFCCNPGCWVRFSIPKWRYPP